MTCGTKVGFTKSSGNADTRTLTIASSEKHNGLTFYRVQEIPEALFIESSLYAKLSKESK